uniref:ADAMTS-like protein 3 n=1 Tax=Myxine glutinosa TaxID=7769 RepID=UPI00358FF613
MALIAAHLYLLAVAAQVFGEQPLVFLPEFFLSRRESLKDEMPSAPLLTVHSDEQVTQAVERDPLADHQEAAWEAWGTWSECSRTCGGGASYSLRRCRPRSNCRGRNIRYRSCSTEHSSIFSFKCKQAGDCGHLYMVILMEDEHEEC